MSHRPGGRWMATHPGDANAVSLDGMVTEPIPPEPDDRPLTMAGGGVAATRLR